tara:strand:- start:2825 stop:3286 length:462 start_codon:yes stop_codon:yes gene_type:complete
MRNDVLNKSSTSYGNVPDFYPNGFSVKTAGFTAEAGYTYLVTDLDGCAIVLPAPTHGARIKIVIGAVTSNTHTITCNATTTLFEGYALLGDDIDGTVAQHAPFAADESNDDVLTMNGTTTGNGGVIELVGMSAARWKVEAVLYASGTIATPFS